VDPDASGQVEGAEGPAFYTLSEAATRVGMSPESLRKRCARDGVPGAKKMKHNNQMQWFIPREAVEGILSGRFAPDIHPSGSGQTGVEVVPPTHPDSAVLVDLMREMVSEMKAIRAALERPPEVPPPPPAVDVSPPVRKPWRWSNLLSGDWWMGRG
jgi:hypothetical protein